MKKLFTISIFIIVIISLSLHFLIEIKKHNLAVTNNIRLCASLKGEAVLDCAEAMKSNYLFR